MKIATWNVNGIRAREAQLCDWLERDRPDVVCLQEIKARPDQIPGRWKLAFLTGLAAWSEQLHEEGRELILCGDINVARADIDVHPKERKADVIGQRPEERNLFQALLDSHLVDVTRALDPDNPGLFTWWPPWRNMRQRNIGWRIDYILASPAIAEGATRCAVLADIGTSDHAPIMMTTEWG